MGGREGGDGVEKERRRRKGTGDRDRPRGETGEGGKELRGEEPEELGTISGSGESTGVGVRGWRAAVARDCERVVGMAKDKEAGTKRLVPAWVPDEWLFNLGRPRRQFP